LLLTKGRPRQLLELLLRSGIDLVATPARAVGYLAAVARGFGKVRPQPVKNGVASVPVLPPATSFNDVVGWRPAFPSFPCPSLTARRYGRALGSLSTT